MDDNTPRRCFMDGIDWQHHLDGDADGTLLVPSEGALRKAKTCLAAAAGGCGVVEVEVRIVRWVEPQDLKYYDEKGNLVHARPR